MFGCFDGMPLGPLRGFSWESQIASRKEGRREVLEFCVQAQTLRELWDHTKQLCIKQEADFDKSLKMPPLGKVEGDLDSGIDG